jgi:hypothetical protein
MMLRSLITQEEPELYGFIVGFARSGNEKTHLPLLGFGSWFVYPIAHRTARLLHEE